MDRNDGRSNRNGGVNLWPLAGVAAVGLLTAAVAQPAITHYFAWKEPAYTFPLRDVRLQIRADRYGSGRFGARRSGGRKHKGVDFAAPVGTPVLAAKSGWAWIGQRNDGMGNHVLIKHPDGTTTRYGHLDTTEIADGQWIWQGTPVGTVGKSGNAKAKAIRAHLHFEVLTKRGLAVNPLPQMDINRDD
ncbi:MAG: hypothetical protein COV76_02230 [Candidatus Omnitrophica bacterium CG11_big_fil_rev_8_21_14_0_20_64_10]|nr:MAG: hypothetical protein COV76_02230 [Candidatus Omnitrophica bacterium CG11_big_fil_rev_8_21_14_0_20_64_10]